MMTFDKDFMVISFEDGKGYRFKDAPAGTYRCRNVEKGPFITKEILVDGEWIDSGKWF